MPGDGLRRSVAAFLKAVNPGETITVMVKVTGKIKETHGVVFDCSATDQNGERVIIRGSNNSSVENRLALTGMGAFMALVGFWTLHRSPDFS